VRRLTSAQVSDRHSVPLGGVQRFRRLAKPRNRRQRTARGAAEAVVRRPARRESSRGPAVISKADSHTNGNPLGNPDGCRHEQRKGRGSNGNRPAGCSALAVPFEVLAVA